MEELVNKKFLFPLSNLQMFSRNTDVCNVNTYSDSCEGIPKSAKREEFKLFTQSQLDMIIQGRLVRERKNWEKQQAVREMKINVKEQLLDLCLPIELAELVDYTNLHTCETSLQFIVQTFQDALEKSECRMTGYILCSERKDVDK